MHMHRKEGSNPRKNTSLECNLARPSPHRAKAATAPTPSRRFDYFPNYACLTETQRTKKKKEKETTTDCGIAATLNRTH